MLPFVPYKWRDPGPRPRSGQTLLEHHFALARSSSSGLDESQMRAVRLVLDTKHNVFITGPPGCGKSHTVRYLFQELERRGVPFAVTSSTGKSAILLEHGATTLHMFMAFGDDGSRMVDQYVKKLQLPSNRQHYERLRRTSLLFIDEISMVNNATLAKCDLILRYIRPEAGNRPFGGLQVVASGDFAQLGQVRNQPGNNDWRLLFQTSTWREAGFVRVHLTTIHRQCGDPAFAALIQRARIGRMTEEDVQTLRSRLLSSRLQPDNPLDVVCLMPTNAMVDAENLTRLSALDASTERVFEARWQAKASFAVAQPNDDRPQNERPMTQAEVDMEAWQFLKHNRAEPCLKLRLGARVMLLTNQNVAEGLANGTIGHVVGFTDAEPIVQFNVPGSEPRPVRAWRWEFPSNGSWSAWYEQIPLTLAWAMTTHKSQGSTLQTAVICLSADNVQYGSGATAISRCKSLRGLFFSDFVRLAIRAHPDVVRYYEKSDEEVNGAMPQ